MTIGLIRGTVAVEKHNDEWDVCAKDTISVLKMILKDVAVDIQHIGSTAIKNICAKPIIDIVIGVNDLNQIIELNSILEENGFLYRGQDHPEQLLYVCGDDNFITHHIHVCIYDSKPWNDYINMRDYLNSHDEDARAYSELKKKLAKKYADDRKTYTSMKAEMIAQIIDKASYWCLK